MRYFLTIVVVAVVIVLHNTKAFASISYADMFLPERGYKPVKDMWQDYKKTLSDNQLYKEWCVNTFEKGEQIYDAYKEIAFDIDYCSNLRRQITGKHRWKPDKTNRATAKILFSCSSPNFLNLILTAILPGDGLLIKIAPLSLHMYGINYLINTAGNT